MRFQLLVLATLALVPSGDAFSPSNLFRKPQSVARSDVLFSASSATNPAKRTLAENRKEGGVFTFNTPYGALNPFGIYYGLTSILLGLPWFVVLTLCQLFYKVTGGRFDKKRRTPIFFTHIWGTALMRLCRCFPKIEGSEILKEFYKE
jgi:hypothetical protein